MKVKARSSHLTFAEDGAGRENAFKSHWVKSENSQSPRGAVLGILVFPLKDTYPFKTANASHASQAAPHPAGTLVTEAIIQYETSSEQTNG